MKARYRVTFDDDTRRWRVWDGRAPKGSGGPGIVYISSHANQRDARAAARRYEANDKRRSKATGGQ